MQECVLDSSHTCQNTQLI